MASKMTWLVSIPAIVAGRFERRSAQSDRMRLVKLRRRDQGGQQVLVGGALGELSHPVIESARVGSAAENVQIVVADLLLPALAGVGKTAGDVCAARAGAELTDPIVAALRVGVPAQKDLVKGLHPELVRAAHLREILRRTNQVGSQPL